MLRYRKGELQFYKSSLPKELKKYLRGHPENEKYVTQFLDEYEYNYVKKIWKKREDRKSLLEKMKGDD